MMRIFDHSEHLSAEQRETLSLLWTPDVPTVIYEQTPGIDGIGVMLETNPVETLHKRALEVIAEHITTYATNESKHLH